MNLDDLVEAWRVNNAVTLELLAACPDEAFECKPGKGKTIRSNFVHLVGVRKMWLEDKMAADAKTVPKLDWKSATRDEIIAGLELTSGLMAKLFEKRATAPPRPGQNPLRFFAYAIAHEAHHRSQIEIALRINGFEPGDAFLYGLWEWAKK